MDDQRLLKLEEALAFLDRRLDDLDDAVRSTADRLDQTARRLGMIESSLEQLRSTAADEDDPAHPVSPNQDILDNMPPHAARSPYDRPSDHTSERDTPGDTAGDSHQQ